jgi:hypothetical protein
MAGAALSGAASGAAAGSAAGPWGAAIGAGLGLVGGLMGNKAAKRAQKQANALEARRLGLVDTLQNRYFDKFVPLQDKAIALASRPVDPNVEAAAAGADVEQQAAIQRGVALRNLGLRGISPDAGAAVDADFRLGLGTALGRAAAGTAARRNARGEELRNLLTVADMGNPLLGQASAGLADIGDARNARAAAATEMAGQAWGQFGESAADLVSYFANRPGAPAGQLMTHNYTGPGLTRVA